MSTPENLGALLLPWLKANAEEMAADLRDAGWEKDGRGLWSLGAHRRLHLFDAHEIARREATFSGSPGQSSKRNRRQCMDSKPSRDELEKQIRYHEGQSQWNRWTNRVEKLEEDVETYAFWADASDITGVCTGMPAVHAALTLELQKARDHLATLAEFASKPKGRKKA